MPWGCSGNGLAPSPAGTGASASVLLRCGCGAGAALQSGRWAGHHWAQLARRAEPRAGHGGCASADPHGEMGGYERWGKDNEGIKPTVVSSESLSSFPYPWGLDHQPESRDTARLLNRLFEKGIYSEWCELQPAQLPLLFAALPGTSHPPAAALENMQGTPGIPHTSSYTHEIPWEFCYLLCSIQNLKDH